MLSARSVINFGIALVLSTLVTLAAVAVAFGEKPVPDLPVAVAIGLGTLGVWAWLTSRQFEREADRRREELQSFMPLSPEEEDEDEDALAAGPGRALARTGLAAATSLPLDRIDDLRQIRRHVDLHRGTLLRGWRASAQAERAEAGAGYAAWERYLDDFFATHVFSGRVMSRGEVRAALTSEVEALAERDEAAVRAEAEAMQEIRRRYAASFPDHGCRQAHAPAAPQPQGWNAQRVHADWGPVPGEAYLHPMTADALLPSRLQAAPPAGHERHAPDAGSILEVVPIEETPSVSTPAHVPAAAEAPRRGAHRAAPGTGMNLRLRLAPARGQAAVMLPEDRGR